MIAEDHKMPSPKKWDHSKPVQSKQYKKNAKKNIKLTLMHPIIFLHLVRVFLCLSYLMKDI